MDTVSKILVVDDEPLNIEIMREYLEERFQNIEYVTNGMECLDKLKSYLPDVVLLDVSMPMMDGYEVCRKIKENSEYQSVSVIFVSARGTPEERMAGFQAGGDDYIVKPFEEKELMQKLERTLDFRNDISELKTRLDDAENTAFEAMMGNAEIGYVVQYLDQLFELSSPEEIARSTLALMNTLELGCAIRVVSSKEVIYQSHKGAVAPLERDLLDVLKDKGRMYHFENRSQFNYPCISLLVKNMPVNDETKYGRIKDIVPIALNGANTCIKSLIYRQSAKDKVNIQKAIATINQSSDTVVASINSVNSDTKQVLEKLNAVLEHSVPFMGLEDDQEALISNATDEVINTVRQALSSLEAMTLEMQKIKEQSQKFSH